MVRNPRSYKVIFIIIITYYYSQIEERLGEMPDLDLEDDDDSDIGELEPQKCPATLTDSLNLNR